MHALYAITVIVISSSSSSHLPCFGRVCVCVGYVYRCKASFFSPRIGGQSSLMLLCPTKLCIRGEVEASTGNGCVPAWLVNKYIYIYKYVDVCFHPAPGRSYVAAGGDIYFIAVGLYCQ